jgi:hypothetical protein
MKFVKEYLAQIEGVATYPMISLIIFFVFFSALFLWVFTARKPYLKKMSEMPLDLNSEDTHEH